MSLAKRLSALNAGAALLWLCAWPVTGSAQQVAADRTMEEIFVTGSRIARSDLTANSPINVIDAESLQVTNTVNVEEFLRKMPQFAQAIGRNTNNGNPGVATLDLRNLGEERTLVLMDGKRFIPYDADGIVDVGMIPASLIERVEVITGGASSVYGADAVAGVVNFIMKKDFEGIEFNSSAGITEEGDGNIYDLSVTLGGNFADGRGNIVFNAGYSKQDAVTQGERPFGVEALDDLLDPVGSFTTPQGTAFDSSFPGDPEGGLTQFDPNGNTVPFSQTFNFNPFNLYQVPQKKWTLTTIGRYEVTDQIEFFARGSFANNRVDTIIAPSGTFFESFPLAYQTNPFLGPAAVNRFTQVDNAESDPATAGDGIVEILLGRRLVEIGTRNSDYENTAYQIVGGFTGDFAETQHWEVFGQWGRTSRTQNFDNDTTISKVQQAAFDVILDPLTNQPVCVDPSGGCAPANLFGGTMSQEAADFLRTPLVETNTTSQMVFGGSVSGDLPFTLPTAENALGYAVGIEYREEKSDHRPDDNYATGNAIGFGSSSPISAQIEVFEIFGEALVPLVTDAAFAREINLEGGVRWADYENRAAGVSNSFQNTSYKFGGDWVVVDGLRFRGMFQRAVRTPSLSEIGLPRTPSTGDLDNDPCEGTNPVGNAELTALCIATGVPPAAIGSVVSIIAGQINNFVGGKPDLEPEEADTITAGVVFTPEFLEGLEFTLDYYNIDIDNVIVQVTEQNVVDACYNIEKNAAGTFCSLIFRNPINGGLTGPKQFGVDVSLINGGFLKVEGIDFGARYGFDFDRWGTLDLSISGTHVLGNEQQDAAFLPSFECAGLVGNICLRPSPEWTWIQTTEWRQGPFMVQLQWQFIDRIAQDAIKLGGADPSDFAVPEIASQSYFDLYGSWEIDDTWTARLGVQNLFDRDPPITGNDYGGTAENSGNTFPATYDPLGRKYFLAINAKF